jgi:hypothetical protein
MLVGVLDSTDIPAFGGDFRSTVFVRPVGASVDMAVSRETGTETVATRGRA